MCKKVIVEKDIVDEDVAWRVYDEDSPGEQGHHQLTVIARPDGSALTIEYPENNRRVEITETFNSSDYRVTY